MFLFFDARGSTTSSKVLKSQKHPRVPLKATKVIYLDTQLQSTSGLWFRVPLFSSSHGCPKNGTQVVIPEVPTRIQSKMVSYQNEKNRLGLSPPNFSSFFLSDVSSWQYSFPSWQIETGRHFNAERFRRKNRPLSCLKMFEKKRHHPPPRNHQSLVPSHPPPKTCVASIVAAHATTGGTTPAPSPWKWR